MADAKPAGAQAGAERRRVRRLKMDLPGRLFLPADSREAACTILDMSPGGAAISSGIVPELGSAVVLYMDSFGRFEGRVVRRGQAGFGLAFVCTPSKRKRTAEQLILFVSRHHADGTLALILSATKNRPPNSCSRSVSLAPSANETPVPRPKPPARGGFPNGSASPGAAYMRERRPACRIGAARCRSDCRRAPADRSPRNPMLH